MGFWSKSPVDSGRPLIAHVLTGARRRLLAMTIDVVIVASAYTVAVVLRFAAGSEWTIPVSGSLVLFTALAVTTYLGANWCANVYAIVNRYISLPQAMGIVKASAVATTFLLILAVLWPAGRHLPLSSVLLGGLMSMVAMVGVRFYDRVFHERRPGDANARRRLLIVGAGDAASAMIRETRRNPSLGVHVVGLVDDDPRLQHMRVDDVPVLGTVEEIAHVAAAHRVSEILIAIPSSTAQQVSRIDRLSRQADVPVKTLPSLSEMIDGHVSLSDARELDIVDLLGRPKVEIDLGSIAAYLRHKRILVTGAGGSVGSELVRQIAGFEPAELVMIDHDESALYAVHEGLSARGFTSYNVEVTSILNTAKMDLLFGEYEPHVVFHAAAYKHVPLMEIHPDEAVLNNVKGTAVVAEAAARHGASIFVNISTDKAVDPVNVMGATKRLGELLLAEVAARFTGTHFCSVRFGNVLGSRGSVIPIFQHQIKAGGPVTITHPEMTRYFMSIEEAAKLVLQAAALALEPAARPGLRSSPFRVFVLEMGDPISIVDLATQMLLRSASHGDGRARSSIGVEFVGLRPGEKIEEALFYPWELPMATTHPMIRVATQGAEREPSGNGRPSALTDDFDGDLRRLIRMAESHADPDRIVEGLESLVSSYRRFDRSQVGRLEPSDHDHPSGVIGAMGAGARGEPEETGTRRARREPQPAYVSTFGRDSTENAVSAMEFDPEPW